MQDHPRASELLDAVREFLEQEILPTLTDQRIRFRTLVAVNALRILLREQELEDRNLQVEAAALSELLGLEGPLPSDAASLRTLILDLNARLASLIRRGEPPAGTTEHLRRVGAAKLEVASPEYLERYEG